MTDFLFSFQQDQEELLADALAGYRCAKDWPLHVYSGEWGALAVSGQGYPGFDLLNTERYLFLILGGPLPRYDDSVARGDLRDDGTTWIAERWKVSGTLRWDRDLVGYFLAFCVDKKERSAQLVTDINAFVPAYVSANQPCVVGSHADAVALAAGCADGIDPVSVADFLTYGTVTYPRTMYKGVQHLAPASVTHFSPDGKGMTRAYWKPLEGKGFANMHEAALRLRTLVSDNVRRICAGQASVGLLMSGGEDSRVVAGLIPQTTRVHAVTFTDAYNREARIAERVCRKLRIPWESALRAPTHYLDHAVDSIRLTESHNYFCHAHLNGFTDRFPAGCRVLGGFFADGLFKGYRIKTTYVAGLQWAIIADAWQHGAKVQLGLYSDEVHGRRQRQRDSIRTMRPISWAEWCAVHPACMSPGCTNLLANRRLIANYEPFADSLVVKLGAMIPQTWKLNRRLFHRAMRPVLTKTWGIAHGRGWFPAFGPLANVALRHVEKARRRMVRILQGRPIPANDGPWPVWREVVSHPAFAEISPPVEACLPETLSPSEREMLGALLRSCDGKEWPKMRLRALQVKLWLAGRP